MNEKRYPWFILVPEREGLSEIYQLTDADQYRLIAESSSLARGLVAAFSGDKLNIAALGNLVPQLHIHHVVRFRHDPAWPAPVWGKFSPLAYDDAGLAEVVARLQAVLPDVFLGSLA